MIPAADWALAAPAANNQLARLKNLAANWALAAGTTVMVAIVRILRLFWLIIEITTL